MLLNFFIIKLKWNNYKQLDKDISGETGLKAWFSLGLGMKI